VLANVVVMVVLHGNSRQVWPKVPYLSLRDESTGEHVRLLFNTLSVTTALQAAAGGLPRERWLSRALTLGVIPALLPALIFFGQRVLRLRGQAAYNLSLVPRLPIAAVAVEEALASQIAQPATDASRADYEHLV
jgi:hypothetical protein